MKLYKLTDAKDQSRGGCQWGPNVQRKTSGEGDLCGPGWTHWYTHPLLAVLLNPIHSDLDLSTAHLWEGKGRVGKRDCGLKVGCKDGMTIRQIDLPQVTLEQWIRFGILCSLAAIKGQRKAWMKGHRTWARNWLTGEDRSNAAAWAAEEAARAASRAAAAWAAEEAARAAAAWAAEEAARAASRAARAWAAWVAEEAADAAAWAAAAGSIDLLAIAKQAMEAKPC